MAIHRTSHPYRAQGQQYIVPPQRSLKEQRAKAALVRADEHITLQRRRLDALVKARDANQHGLLKGHTSRTVAVLGAGVVGLVLAVANIASPVFFAGLGLTFGAGFAWKHIVGPKAEHAAAMAEATWIADQREVDGARAALQAAEQQRTAIE